MTKYFESWQITNQKTFVPECYFYYTFLYPSKRRRVKVERKIELGEYNYCAFHFVARKNFYIIELFIKRVDTKKYKSKLRTSRYSKINDLFINCDVFDQYKTLVITSHHTIVNIWEVKQKVLSCLLFNRCVLHLWNKPGKPIIKSIKKI